MSSNVTTVGWVPEDGGRGTWSIIWPCLSTLFLAIWVSWHPTAPAADEKLVNNLLRLFYAGLCMVFPEINFMFATAELVESIELQKKLKGFGLECSLVQTFYVGMGGYTTVVPSEKTQPAGDSTAEDDDSTIPDGLRVLVPDQILWLSERHILRWPGSANALRYTDHGSGAKENLSGPGNAEPLQITTTKNNQEISVSVDPDHKENSSLPAAALFNPVQLLSTAQIKERSTADGLAKLIVVIQSIWFVLNCIFRGAHRLPLAPLEVLTLTYLVGSLAAYLLWWHKPYAISYSTQLDLSLSAEQWQIMKDMNDEKTWETTRFTNSTFTKWGDFYGDYVPLKSGWTIIMVFWLSGATHFIAWNAMFPTQIEQTLWRVAAIILVATPVLMIGDARMFLARKHFLSEAWTDRITIVGGILMVITKLFVLVEAFAAFRSMPSTIYDTWEPSNYIFSFI